MRLGARILLHISRSLVKYWGVSLLNIIGFAIGTAAALTIVLYVRNELTFDRFIPDADKVMLVSAVYSHPGSPVVSNDKAPAALARWLRADAPAIEAAARLHAVEWSIRSPRRQSLEYFYWADPNIFDLLKVQAVAGDLRTALQKPYTMVLTQKMAKRYFGRDDVVGQTVFINGGSPVTITAVLADFPVNSSLGREIFVSGVSDYGMLALLDQHPDWLWSSTYTFLRLKPGMTLAPQDAQRIAARHWSGTSNLPVKFRFIPLTDLHFQPEADSQMTPRGHLDTVFAMIGLAAFVQFLAAVNLACLMTAQIEERRSEMAVRRSLGAKRHHLFLQVLLEAAILALLAVFTGLMLVERLLPTLNGLLGLQLSLWTSPVFLACCLIGALFAGIAAGLHPAIVLSSTPTIIARGRGAASSYITRIGWIVVQFALLITLLISSQIVYRQWAFATGKALNFNAANVLQIAVYNTADQNEAFRRHLLQLKGVEDAAYSRFVPEDTDIRPAWAMSPAARPVQFNRQSVDTNFFRMYGVRILAGRNFNTVYNLDQPPAEIILSQSAATAFGYRQPADAIGRMLDYEADNHARVRSKIVGVVDDMRIDTVRDALRPLVFDNQSFFFTRLNVRLKPRTEAATLAAIDRVWQHDFPQANPINRHFFTEYLNELYHDMVQQWWAFGLLSVVGVCLSILGLAGLTMYLARSQMHEMAIRNALGAGLWDIFRLRLTPFVTPLLIANVAAGVLSWLLMSLWLESFKAHVGIDPLSFVIAGAATVAITLVTLAVHSVLSSPARSSRPLYIS